MTLATRTLNGRPPVELHTPRLPRWTPVALGTVALAASAGLFLGTGAGGPVVTVTAAGVLYLVFTIVAASVVEGGRKARDRAATALVHAAFTIAVVPLALVAWTLVSKGVSRLDTEFFFHSMNNITAMNPGGGAYHAIVGTLQQLGIATVVTVPLGILGAVYVVEYGRGKLSLAIRFFVDVMTGIPSIVAGLFILAFWVLIVTPYFNNGRPGYSGLAAALALSVLMLPTVVRSTEEMLRLVPNALREGAYALGVPRWKTIMRVVLPTAMPGIVTGVMLAIARAAGETAPVLLVAGGIESINFNPFSGNQSSLSLYVYQQSGLASQYAPARAWTAALTLVAVVLALTVAAKLVARRNKIAR
jgi:phosphate transport system permease protein